MAIENNTILLLITYAGNYFVIHRRNPFVGSIFFFAISLMFLYEATVGIPRLTAVALIIISLVGIIYNYAGAFKK